MTIATIISTLRAMADGLETGELTVVSGGIHMSRNAPVRYIYADAIDAQPREVERDVFIDVSSTLRLQQHKRAAKKRIEG